MSYFNPDRGLRVSHHVRRNSQMLWRLIIGAKPPALSFGQAI